MLAAFDVDTFRKLKPYLRQHNLETLGPDAILEAIAKAKIHYARVEQRELEAMEREIARGAR